MEEKIKKNRNKKWIRKHHLLVRHIFGIFFLAYARLKYGARVRPFKEESRRQYLVLFNHQTAFDQFFVALSFRQHLYFLASEDIFSQGILSSALRYLVAPIPIKKQTTDLQAVKNCIKVAREGGTIALAPEGNRTYHGRTVYMKPGIASLAKKLGMPLAIVRIEGGYGVQPRWSDVTRKGKMRAYVSEVIEPEQMAAMSEEEQLQLLASDGMLVKRPIVVTDSVVLTGFKEAEWEERL